MAPYSWSLTIPKTPLDASFVSTSKHPLTEVRELFGLMRNFSADLPRIRAFADAIISKYDLLKPGNTLIYPEPYNIMPAGFTSSMGNFELTFLLLDLYERTKEPRYQTAALNLFSASAREMKDGGTIIEDEQGCHLVEFAHREHSYEDVLVVLNGHLHALQSLLILSHHPQTADAATRLYTCGKRKTLALASDFRGQGFPFYQLNPKRVDMIHYLIFEMLQFRSLFAMSGDEFYQQEAEFRENVFRQVYPVVYRQGDDESYEYLVSLVSAPQPYLIDTFRTSLTCKGPDGRIQEDVRDIASTQLADRAFLRIVSEQKLTSCALSSSYSNITTSLYSDFEPRLIDGNDQGTDVPFDVEAHHDAKVSTESGLAIDPSISDSFSNALAVLRFKEPIKLASSDLVVLRMCGAADGWTMYLRVSNAAGKTIARAWPQVKNGGCNKILFSPLGFHDYETVDLSTIAAVGFYLDTRTGPAYTLDGLSVSVLKHPFQVLRETTQDDGYYFAVR